MAKRKREGERRTARQFRPLAPDKAFKERWETLYRSAVLEFDHNRLPQRIADAKAAISARALRLTKSPAGHEKEEDAIKRALHILQLLQEGPPL